MKRLESLLGNICFEMLFLGTINSTREWPCENFIDAYNEQVHQLREASSDTQICNGSQKTRRLLLSLQGVSGKTRRDNGVKHLSEEEIRADDS